MPSLADKIRNMQTEQKARGGEREVSLENAERLADRFAHIQPKPSAMPLEQYFVTPVDR